MTGTASDLCAAPPRPTYALPALLGAVVLGNVDIAVTNTAAPAIQADLAATGAELELLVSGFTVSYAALLIIGARLGQSRGYRSAFLRGLAVFTVASVVCGLAPGASVLVVARLVQGAGAALMTAQVLTGIQLEFSGRARTRALGWFAAVLAGSAVLGQLAGGVIVSADLFGTSWRPVFLINLPLGVALHLIASRALPHRDGRRERLDLTGAALLSGGLMLLIVPLVLGRDLGWPLWTWISVASSVAVFVTLVAFQRRLLASGGHPIVDVGLFARRVFSFGLLAGTLSTATYFAILFVLALYLQHGLGRSPAFSGVALMPWVAAFGIAGPVLGRLGSAAQLAMAPVGGLLLAVAFGGISGLMFAGVTSTVPLLALLALGGFGLGAIFSGSLARIVGTVATEHAADVSGLFTTFTRVGGAIGVAGFGTLYLAIAGHGAADAEHAFAVTTAALAATAAVSGVCALVATSSPVLVTNRYVATALRTSGRG